jgi:hypothetical protein
MLTFPSEQTNYEEYQGHYFFRSRLLVTGNYVRTRYSTRHQRSVPGAEMTPEAMPQLFCTPTTSGSTATVFTEAAGVINSL